MNPEAARAWIGVIRDFATVSLGVYIVIRVVESDDPSIVLLAFAGTLFGLPAAIRIDEWATRRTKAEKGAADA